MKLYALGDLHLAYPTNQEALSQLRPHPGDGLILCGDVGETPEHLELAFSTAKRNFDQVFWCPGNHELYTITTQTALRGEEKYLECVEIARKYGVHTPEDAFVKWEGNDGEGACIIAPIFTLYDYSFRPENIGTKEEALKWAEQADTIASDEFLLHPDPYPSREEWCEVLISKAEMRLEEAAKEGLPLVIINHWPLRQDLVYIPRVPRFSLWCGTKKTEDFHKRFGAKVVVSGHLHVPRTDWKEGVRFEECSLGYPREWDKVRKSGVDLNELLREILPGPEEPEGGEKDMVWRRWG